jgi:hypothetical protein
LVGDRQFVRRVNHRLALNKPALPSAPSKKSFSSVSSPILAALKAGVWFRRGRLLIVSPDSLGTACPLSGRNSTYRPVQISAAGSYCQRCGVRYPANTIFSAEPETKGLRGPRNRRGLGILLLIIIGLAVLFHGSNTSKGTNERPPNPLCESDWTRCIDNADLMNNYLYHNPEPQVNCKHEAMKRAQYGDPKFPWLDQYPKIGIAILIEKDAQYQNGFGAMVHSEVKCTYDLRAKQVLNIEISSR